MTLARYSLVFSVVVLGYSGVVYRFEAPTPAPPPVEAPAPIPPAPPAAGQVPCGEHVFVSGRGWVAGAVSPWCREWCCRGVWLSQYQAETRQRAIHKLAPIRTPDAKCKHLPWYEALRACRCDSGARQLFESTCPERERT